MTSMLNRWAPWYSTGQRRPYGPTYTYLLAEEWLAGLHVEDWGCGYARFKDFHKGGYVGVDGTAGWADHVADLTTHRNPTEGLLLRHVLEHNHDWRAILRNAIASFTKRMVLVIFTPDSGIRNSEKVLAHVSALGVDDLALPHWTIEHEFLVQPCEVVTKTHLPTATGYSGETIWLVEKR